MIKLCVFDLDGTLANTAPTIAHFGNLALSACGCPQLSLEQYKQIVGNGVFTLIARMVQASTGRENKQLEQRIYELYQREYDADTLYLTQPYEGILSMLVELKNRHIRTAVLSNKPHNNTVEVVARLFPNRLIDRAQGQLPEIPIKPDPSALLALLAQEGVAPQETLYVGDSGVDMETGRNAGIVTVGVDWGFRSREELTAAGADHIISNPQELVELTQRVDCHSTC
ncbi:MAG: HAD family hydrolase [Eubacteriales bacterium]|jgi:phosphoglycolate phosphatase